MRGVVTGPSSRGTMRDILPPAAVDRVAMMDLPPSQTRFGSAPTPICRQAPSATSPVIVRLIVFVLGSRAAGGQLQQGHMVFNNRVHLRDMQLRAVTVDTRHVFVDLDDQPFGRAGCLVSLAPGGASSDR